MAREAVFIIPGDEAGDNSDLLPELETFLENINDELINGLDEDESV
jgi:hypothetical protein